MVGRLLVAKVPFYAPRIALVAEGVWVALGTPTGRAQANASVFLGANKPTLTKKGTREPSSLVYGSGQPDTFLISQHPWHGLFDERGRLETHRFGSTSVDAIWAHYL